MEFSITIAGKSYSGDFSKPINIAHTLEHEGKLKAFYAPQFQIETFQLGNFIGDIKQGSPVNVKEIKISPHGNGTHTECLAHVTDTDWDIVQTMNKFHFSAQLLSIQPDEEDGDVFVSVQNLKDKIKPGIEALIIRTLPNDLSNKTIDYSGGNPCYIQPDAMQYILSAGIQHILVDFPSVDKEDDGGKVLSHKIFWQVGKQERKHSSITELIYVPEAVQDGLYLCNIQLLNIQGIDASPSKPVLYELA